MGTIGMILYSMCIFIFKDDCDLLLANWISNGTTYYFTHTVGKTNYWDKVTIHSGTILLEQLARHPREHRPLGSPGTDKLTVLE